MAPITVEGLSPDEETQLRELAEVYANPQFLDYQDISSVETMARGLLRLLARLTAKPAADKPRKKVSFIQ